MPFPVRGYALAMTMAKGLKAEPTIEESIHVNAPPQAVWDMVTDLRRMGEWSGQARGGWWLSRRGPALGSRFLGLNRLGRARWVTTTKVIRFEAPSVFAFRTEQNRAVWVYVLQSDGNGGTTLVHRRELPDGRPAMARAVARMLFGGAAKYDSTVSPGMQNTLSNIKRIAESSQGH